MTLYSNTIHLSRYKIVILCRTERDEDDIEDVYNILESYALQV